MAMGVVGVLESLYEELSIKNVTMWLTSSEGKLLPLTDVRHVLCPRQCNDHGTCAEGKCICRKGRLLSLCLSSFNTFLLVLHKDNSFHFLFCVHTSPHRLTFSYFRNNCSYFPCITFSHTSFRLPTFSHATFPVLLSPYSISLTLKQLPHTHFLSYYFSFSIPIFSQITLVSPYPLSLILL